MKKTLILLLSALAALQLVSCGDAIEIPDVNGSGNTPPDIPAVPSLSGDVVFTATVEDLPDGSQPVWATGETILLWDGSTVQTLTNRAADGRVAEFPGKVEEGKTAFMAVSPAVADVTFDGTTVSFEVPSVQAGATPAFKVAKASGTLLYFKSLVSEIQFSVEFEGATRVRFEATGGQVSGQVTADYAGEQPVAAATEDYVEVTGPFEAGKTYSFSVLAGSIDSYSVTVFAGDAAKAHVGGGAVDLKAGLSATLPVIKEDVPTYRITNLWLWGGTGPEYDCTKVYDLLTKPGCFNDEDGRGITALKDNYFQLHSDGTFVNYAGEDGRNWWFVYSGSQNPANGKDVDLRSFYDLLPLSEGSYSIEGNQVTFTRPDGKSVTATWVGPGSYEMPGTNKPLSVTIRRQALMFTIKGGKDNWDYPWQDYGVIACHPRVLFIEMEQLPDGFVVPETSRTFDADFEYVPPVDPGDIFDWMSLPGKWNVLGGNSAPFGIWVLGGSGDDPAFVSPIDKSWDWNDSIWRESDNGLVIELTSYDNVKAQGTTNWWAGNDGKFWDYTWKNTGEDLSRFYNKIPKGKYAFTLDFATLTVTLGNGEKARFLTPGTHEFVYGKTREIPDGCFGLWFHLMDPIPATSQRWTDVDRFVNAPLEYVIMFEKQQ